MKYFTLSVLLVLCTTLTASAQPPAPDLKGKSLADTFTELLPAIGKGDNGAQQRWQDICFAVGAPGNEKLRAEACELMAAKLDAKTPKPARIWLLTQLIRIGREESVDALATVLDEKDDEVRDITVRALANNPSPKATGKLTAKLGDAKGKAKIGLLNALGHRADPEAVGLVARELKADDSAVAIAAARAIGRTPGATGLALLVAARGETKGTVHAAICDAMMVHADRMAAAKDASAADIYKMLNTTDEPKPIRLAALRGTIQSSGDKAGELVLTLLGGKDAEERAIGVGQIENLNAAALKPLAGSLDKLPVPSRVLVITAIAARGDKSQLPVAVNAAKSDNADVKRTGVLALGRLGDASTVELLLDLMSSKDATAGVAAESLANLPAEGVNEKLVAVLETEKSPARAVTLIGVLDRRKAPQAVPALLKAAGSADAGVRTAAFNALKSLATPQDIPGMIAALLKTAKGGERDQAEQAIVAVASQVTQPEKRAEPVLAAIKNDSKRTADLLPLLGRLGGNEARTVIREAIASTDPATHDAGIVAISNWPDINANEDLLALAEKGKDAEKQRALQALIRVNTVLIDRTSEQRLAALGVMKKAMDLASRDEERRAILEGLGNVRHIDTLRYVVPYLDQPALAQAACKGIVELAHSKMLRDPNKAEFVKVLDRVIAMCKDKGLVERAKGYKSAP